jgi:hypothetical protein
MVGSTLETYPLETKESLFFMGVEGDFSGELEDALTSRLQSKLKLEFVGKPIRSSITKERKVWAVRTELSSKALAKSLKKELRKSGYKATLLNGTAFSLLAKTSGSTVHRAFRDLARSESKIWAFDPDSKAEVIWVFHDPKIDSAKLKKSLRETKLKLGFHHIKLGLTAEHSQPSEELVSGVGESLDLVTVKKAGQGLQIDIYLRDIESMMALEEVGSTVACPNLQRALLKNGPADLAWTVSLENPGFPFAE